MTRYPATSVGVLADTDHGEGWVVFRWPHERYGHEELKINLDGHCSRRMPLRSGTGPPEFIELSRDRVKLRLTPTLARSLRLPEEIEIVFHTTDHEFAELRRVVDFFNGVGT